MKVIDYDLEPAISIGSDTPQSDPIFDAYGYAHFAKLMASAIVKTPSPLGLVMAIHGPWGSGKTSLLNFVKYYLNEEPEVSRPVVIDFNPWWFEDKGQLASQFLTQFKAKLKLETGLLRNAGDLMADYSGALGKAVAVSTGLPWIDVPIGWLLKLLKRKPKDIPSLKADISKALKDGGRRFLVLIDDIDRLTPAEIREVFKVVKALADFPNVVYLLSFDRAVTAKALSDSMGLDGEAYLEKIVQAPFVLPVVDRRKLQQKLFADLDKLLEGADLRLFDKTYWGNVFVEGMASLVSKPRDIVRYINALSVTFPALRDEVNITDFFALEFLRVNLPQLYDTIRENPDRFTGTSNHGIRSGDRKKDLEFHDAWAAELDEDVRDGIRSMMERLFPKIDNMGRGSDFLKDWRRLGRVAHPDVFPSYFQFTIDSDRLSRHEIATFIDGLTDQKQTQKTLLDAINVKRADGASMAKEYLDRVLDCEEEIDPGRASNLLITLNQIGDNLIIQGDEAGGLFAVPCTWRLLWVMQHALARIPEGERDALLISAFKDGQSVTFLTMAISAIEDAHKTPKDHGPSAVLTTIKKETVVDLKLLAVERINAFAQNGSLIDTPNLLSVLFRWKDWGTPDDPRRWVAGFVFDKEKLARLLSTFLSETKIQTFGDAVGRIRHTLNLKNLGDFLDLDKAAELFDQYRADEPSDERLRLTWATFNRQYSIYTAGKDPDSPFARLDMDQD